MPRLEICSQFRGNASYGRLTPFLPTLAPPIRCAVTGEVSDGAAGGRAPEEVYLRFGEVPEGERSYNRKEDCYEEGVAVFPARKMPDGCYVFDLPREEGASMYLHVLFHYLLGNLPLYVARGTEVGEGITAGDTLLRDVTLEGVPPLARVELPEWLGPESKRLMSGWNRWRRNAGGGGKALPPPRLHEQVARALEAADFTCDPFIGREEREERVRGLRRLARSAWKTSKADKGR